MVATEGDDAPRGIGRRIGGVVELATLIGIDDDHPRIAAFQPHGDRRGRERGEQRHVHGTPSPDRQQRHDEFGGLAHQGGDGVTRSDTEFC